MFLVLQKSNKEFWQNMENTVEYETSNINEWFESQCLTQDQLARLIEEKLARAENYLLAHRQVGRHFVCD